MQLHKTSVSFAATSEVLVFLLKFPASSLQRPSLKASVATAARSHPPCLGSWDSSRSGSDTLGLCTVGRIGDRAASIRASFSSRSPRPPNGNGATSHAEFHRGASTGGSCSAVSFMAGVKWMWSFWLKSSFRCCICLKRLRTGSPGSFDVSLGFRGCHSVCSARNQLRTWSSEQCPVFGAASDFSSWQRFLLLLILIFTRLPNVLPPQYFVVSEIYSTEKLHLYSETLLSSFR